MKILENVLLAPYTTFRIGGAARFFAHVKSLEDLEDALIFAEEKKVPVFILGGGSNILISDKGFDGLVIKNEIAGIIEEEVNDHVRVIVGAGESWDNFVKYTVEEKGLFGLENLSYIPGTVGASPVQNIGAYGAEAKDTIEWVEVYNPATKKVEILTNLECLFGYRDSIFKHARKNNIILRVAFLLKRKGFLSIDYKDLRAFFEERLTAPTLREVREAIIKIRTKKLPDLSKMGTAGSFFKNAVISKFDYEKLLEKYPDMPAFSAGSSSVVIMPSDAEKSLTIKIPTAWILDNVCGFKGTKRGEVGVFENQALVLVNFGKGTATEIKSLANEMISCVKEKTGIDISPEVEYVG